MIAYWENLSATAQDACLLVGLVIPGLLLGLWVIRGYRPFSLARSLLWRYRWTNLLFIALMALSVGLGTALTAQERALRVGMARAADKFDLVLAAPGSRIDMMLAAVYLKPIDVPLLGGKVMQELAEDPLVTLAAPIAYGDSFNGHPVIGSTHAFVQHLAGNVTEGRLFASVEEAVIGGRVPLEIGQSFTPAHGHGPAVLEEDAHAGHEITVVGRMPMTGSPWDKAILTPVESVWEVHGLGSGHPEGSAQLGPPFDPDLFPGTPAILVRATELWANYALASKYTRSDVMAFFPGAVLAKLHSLLGDVRMVMSLMATLSQVLVAAGVLAGLVVLAKLFARRFALLRALGAPRRFVFAVMWSYTAALIAGGAALGLLTGRLAAGGISAIVTENTDILVQASLGWPEYHLVAAFCSVTVFLALIPAGIAFRRSVVADLRGN